MPWSIEKRESKWCVIKDSDGSSAGCHDSRTDAIKQQRALYASERRNATVAALVYEEPAPVVDTRLEEAIARVEELASREERNERVNVTVAQDPQVMQALLKTMDQISERLENGERVSASLVASLEALASHAPVVNVPAPVVNVPETVVNVPTPVVNYTPPDIVIPEIKVPPAEITVSMPEERPRRVTFTRDPLDGKLQGAEITEE